MHILDHYLDNVGSKFLCIIKPVMKLPYFKKGEDSIVFKEWHENLARGLMDF